jgi:hypothetical protein
MRKKVAYTLLIIIAALLLAIPVMSIARTRIIQWTLLKTTSWVSIEAEKTIYETADSNHFFIHFRITNQTSHPIAIDLKARNGMWGIFHSFKWNIGQGDGRAPSCSRLIPISLGLNPHEKKMLLTDYKAGKLTTIAPHESVDYYRASQSAGRAEIAKKWSAISLLQKSKTYYPLFPSAAQNLQIIVRGMIRLTDGTQIKCPEISELYVSFPFPLHWKQIPVNGRIVN